MQEIQYDVIREMIDKIVIHERVPKGEVRKIDIYYRFAGKVDFSEIVSR